jgi:hypothetical protein
VDAYNNKDEGKVKSPVRAMEAHRVADVQRLLFLTSVLAADE